MASRAAATRSESVTFAANGNKLRFSVGYDIAKGNKVSTRLGIRRTSDRSCSHVARCSRFGLVSCWNDVMTQFG